jgi:4-hydroxyacetophenone monooxygenase
MKSNSAAALPQGDDVDPEFIRNAVNRAHVNALRLALYQVTGDPELARMRAAVRNVGGREFLDYKLDEKDAALVREKAAAYLTTRNPGEPVPPAPNKAESRRLLELFTAPLTDEEFEFAYEELAFEDFPRDVQWTNGRPDAKLADFKVLVIGAGISGIGAAVQLKRLGIPFSVIERQGDVGGTWVLNTYPEIRVDTSSYLYQFKFEKNFRWSEYYASGQETRAYLDYIVDKYGVRDSFLLNREVVAARWDEARSVWRVTIRNKDGSEYGVEANVVVSASGLFSTPKFPDIPGLKDFGGPIFHTAEWDHSVDHRGKRVALIGTGSTGTQLAPGIAPEVEHLDIYQRTPNWIMKQPNYREVVDDHVRWLFDNMPYYWNWYCYASYFTGTQMQYLQRYDPEWQAKGGLISENNDKMRAIMTEYIREKTGDDPELLAKVLPTHAPFTRRMVVDNGFYDTLRRDNVDLVTDKIERITPAGIRTEDGTERPADLIIIGCGFRVQEYFWPVDYVGRGGATLSELWKRDGARSYKGLALPGMPNFFVLYGPNGQPRAGGFYSWAEIWARYIGDMLVKMIEGNIKSVEVKRDVFDDYNRALDAEMKGIVWEAPGHCYYVNEFGRAALNVPWTTQEYHAMVREADLDDFDVRKAD